MAERDKWEQQRPASGVLSQRQELIPRRSGPPEAKPGASQRQASQDPRLPFSRGFVGAWTLKLLRLVWQFTYIYFQKFRFPPVSDSRIVILPFLFNFRLRECWYSFVEFFLFSLALALIICHFSHKKPKRRRKYSEKRSQSTTKASRNSTLRDTRERYLYAYLIYHALV